MVGGGWTEVQRKKTQNHNRLIHRDEELNNYYVTGFPDGMKKEELHKPFSAFGKVVDVYFGGKKDYYMKNFAFIRYVEDEKAFEETLQGIKSRNKVLVVNISKHPRKIFLMKGREAQYNRPIATIGDTSNQPRPWGNRDSRTFAQALAGNREWVLPSKKPPVVLNTRTYMSEWIKKKVLLGEAHNFDHIGTMHFTNVVNEEIKYLGGLRVAIKFSSSVSVMEFLEDNTRWKNWFKWLIHADQQELQYERTTWLKILGVPLTLWDEDNFSNIARRYGRVVSPFDNISNRMDYSMGKVGVITSERKWINDEITIIANGVKYRVGIVDYTDDWSPFKPLPFDKVEESNDE